MELPFSSLVFVVLWFSSSLCTLLVQSQSPPPPSSQRPPPPSSPPPPPPSSHPPPPPSSHPPPPPSPPPPQSPTLSPPPPESPTPPPPESPNPQPPPESPNTPSPPESPNPPSPPESPNPPSPPESPNPPTPDRPQISSNNDLKRPPSSQYKGQKPRNDRRGHPLPLHRGHKYNAGKKIGLLFVGTAAILQIGVIGFLVFKRRQLLKVKDRYETCS